MNSTTSAFSYSLCQSDVRTYRPDTFGNPRASPEIPPAATISNRNCVVIHSATATYSFVRILVSPPRKGARRRRDIPPQVLAALNRGEIETRSLVEGLAIDATALFRSLSGDSRWDQRLAVIAQQGVVRRTREMGALLRELPEFDRFASHPSDTVRGWAAFALAGDSALDLGRRLEQARPFAADPHSGVREYAWLAVRDAICAEPRAALEELLPWTAETDPHLRRFASEATRPRGVWCPHIPEFKERPEPAAPLLDPLRSDPSRYVRDSVANWLNDASKTRPEWVRATCDRWRESAPTRDTLYTIRRALRTLRKLELDPAE